MLVYAELMNGIRTEMMMDKQLVIISDTGIFIVTTEQNATNYPNEDFYPVDAEAMDAYEIRVESGRVVSNLFPKVRL